MFVYVVLAFAALAVVAAVLAATKPKAARAAEAPVMPPYVPDDGLNGQLYGLHDLSDHLSTPPPVPAASLNTGPSWESSTTAPGEWWGQWSAL